LSKLVAVLACSLVLYVVAATIAPSRLESVRSAHSALVGGEGRVAGCSVGGRLSKRLAAIKDVSAMPAGAPWREMWTQWDPLAISVDDQRVAAIGGNTVRIIVPPFTFGFPRPEPLFVDRLHKAVALATSAGLCVQLTLFDDFGNYSQVAASEKFADALLEPYNASARLSFVELQNEVDPHSTSAMSWTRALIGNLHAVVPGVPVTVSTPGKAGVAGLRQLIHRLGGVQPDFYDFHYYEPAGEAVALLEGLKRLAKPRPLFVGEVGSSSAGTGSNGAEALSAQAQYLATVEGAAIADGLPLAAPWTLNDFELSALPAGVPLNEAYFGLFTAEGRPKPAAAIISSVFRTGHVPVILNAALTDRAGGVPIGWTRANSGQGAFTAGVVQGRASVGIREASGSADRQPAWTTVANLGRLSPQMRVTLTVWACTVSATGTSVAALAWFGVGGRYLGNATSRPVGTGTTQWQRMVVNATAPAGAAYGVVSFQSYDNSGTVWYADPRVELSKASA
jgi:hypothetical protein